MPDDPLEAAVHTAWSVYRATHADVESADGRRCLLERHLASKRNARECETEELVGFGLAYLELFRGDEF